MLCLNQADNQEIECLSAWQRDFHFTSNYFIMKPLTFSKSFLMHLCSNYLFVILSFFLFTSQQTIFAGNYSHLNYSTPDPLFYPDSVEEDSVAFEEGDTVEIYMDGPNTVYVLYTDTSAAQDSLEMSEWAFTDNQPYILIELSDHAGEIQQGLFGLNLTNFFLPKHANINETGAAYGADPTPYDMLSDLVPNVLRFPAGAAGTFMHPLGSPYTTDTEDLLFGELNGGYGYNLEEMIRFFDMTDGEEDVFIFPILDMTDLLGALYIDFFGDIPVDYECQSCAAWMDDGEGAIKNFEDIYLTWYNQPKFDPDGLDYYQMDDLYINDFIRLVQQIETENTGHVVDVIYCADILNQVAGEVVDVINYLKDNEIYDLHVVGVELGNECFSSWFCDAVGFCDDEGISDFEHYYKYINGDDYTGLSGWSNSDLEYVLPDNVESDHDFIEKIRGDGYCSDIKIGLPAAAHRNCGEYIFITDEEEGRGIGGPEGGGEPPCPYPAWNDDMTDHYGDQFLTGNGYSYVFDVVNIHNYLTPTNSPTLNTNFRDIILPPGDDCLDGDYTAGVPYSNYTDGEWDYSPIDPRLECSFYGLMGEGNEPGNFHNAIKTEIYDAQEDHADHLEFLSTDDDPKVKELWMTEYSMSTDKGIPALEKPFIGVIANTFIQAYVTQEWIMDNIKMNFKSTYRDNFFTYATMQNFLGGVPTDVMTPAQVQDQVELGKMTDCGDDVVLNFYAPRIMYYDLLLLKDIFDGDKEFLKSTTTMYIGNPNLPPTVFIDQNEDKIYVVFSNMRYGTQTYYIDPDEVEGLYPGFSINLNNPPIYIYSIDAQQPYSRSGYNSLSAINTYYTSCNDGADYDNWFEITATATETNTGTCAGGWGISDGVCVKVPAYSCGYFVIELDPYRLGDAQDVYRIFPNPASTGFMIQYTDKDFDRGAELQVEIYSTTGNLIETVFAFEGEMIDISKLPVGVYQLVISQNDFNTEKELLVKMK